MKPAASTIDPIASAERRWIVANLACETEFAGLSPQPMTCAASSRLAEVATLLRIFATSDDLLWLPAPLGDASLAEVEGVAMPALHCGASPPELRARRILAWGESAAIERLRATHSPTVLPAHHTESASLAEQLWHAAPPKSSAAAATNDRGFAFQAAERLGTLLPGARIVDTIDALRAHLRAGGAAAAPGERWVLKARFSAAGRQRAFGSGRTIAPRRLELDIARLFACHGSLLFEPWMERLADFGVAAFSDEKSTSWCRTHRQSVDARGRFLGLLVAAERTPGLDASEAARLDEITRATGDLLRARGYRGPFGIDAWRYRDADGATRFQPLGEINARLTAGIVLHAWHTCLREHGTIARDDGIALSFRRRSKSAPATPSGGRIPLVVAGDPPTPLMWLEIVSGRQETYSGPC